MDFSWHRRAQDSIGQARLSDDKRPERYVKGVYPTHLNRGRGCFVWDTEGRRYIDFLMGQGTSILGYAQDRVNAAMVEQMALGSTLSFGTPLEVETAEKLKELFPFVDCVRFFKTDEEARAASLEIADGEGWVVIPSRMENPQRARDEATRDGRLLIFDETDSGFRFRKFGVCNAYNVIPDLLILGGAMANGMPLAAVCGKHEIMNRAYSVGSTFSGETLSLAAAKQTMTLLQTKFRLDDLWLHGQDFVDQFNAIWPEGVTLRGYATRGNFVGPSVELFFQETCRAGVLFSHDWYFSFPHIDEYKAVLGLCKDVLTRIKHGQVKHQRTIGSAREPEPWNPPR